MNTVEDYRLADELPICKCGHDMSWHTGRAFIEGRWSPYWCENLTSTLSDCTCMEFQAVAGYRGERCWCRIKHAGKCI